MEQHRIADRRNQPAGSSRRQRSGPVVASMPAPAAFRAQSSEPFHFAPSLANGVAADLARWAEPTQMLRLLRHQSRHWMVFIALIDSALLVLAVGLAMRARYFADAVSYVASSQNLFWRGALFAAVIVTCMFALGLYQSQSRETPKGRFIRQAVSFVFGTALLTAIYYVMPQAYIGRGVVGLALVFGLAGVAAWRTLVVKLMNAEAFRRRILIFGAGDRAAFITQRMRRLVDRQTFTVVGFVPIPGEAVSVPAQQVVLTNSALHDWAVSRQIDEIIVASDDRDAGLPMYELLECKQRGIKVTDHVSFLERESCKVKLTAPPSWLVFSDGFHASPLRKASKRVFDILGAAVLLVFTSPLMLLTALAIRIDCGPGHPILYSQERVGERGRVFRLYKFRSMCTDAEKGGVAIWARENDDRVTRVGRVIRKLRIDELPQLWNVLRGEMSLIGPRPERPQFVAELSKSIPYYALRHSVKPGLTGWAQLRYPYGSNAEDAAEKLTFDLFYVKNQNLKFDALIFMQTVEVVLFGRGAR